MCSAGFDLVLCSDMHCNSPGFSVLTIVLWVVTMVRFILAKAPCSPPPVSFKLGDHGTKRGRWFLSGHWLVYRRPITAFPCTQARIVLQAGRASRIQSTGCCDLEPRLPSSAVAHWRRNCCGCHRPSFSLMLPTKETRLASGMEMAFAYSFSQH